MGPGDVVQPTDTFSTWEVRVLIPGADSEAPVEVKTFQVSAQNEESAIAQVKGKGVIVPGLADPDNVSFEAREV